MAEAEHDRREGDILLTTAKLAGIAAGLLAVSTFVFQQVMKTEINDLRLEIIKTYATKTETVSKSDYDLRHAELQRQVEKIDSRAGDAERRIEALERAAISDGRRK